MNILQEASRATSKAWKNAYIGVSFLLVLFLPFAMNQLDARESLKQQISERIEQTELLEAGAETKEEKTDFADQIVCLRVANAILTSHIDAGVKQGGKDISVIREQLRNQCNIHQLTDDKNGMSRLGSWSPNSWPSLVLVFFIVSVCSIIGYAATTIREATSGNAELSSRFQQSRVVLAAILAFGFLLALRSGYGIAFAVETENGSHNVYGLAFIGFLVGLFTEKAYEQLEKLMDRDS